MPYFKLTFRSTCIRSTTDAENQDPTLLFISIIRYTWMCVAILMINVSLLGTFQSVPYTMLSAL